MKFSIVSLIKKLRNSKIDWKLVIGNWNFQRELGFTLIELLVVISIIGILIGLSIFGLEGARRSSRDAKRKADLELIRSGLEIYRADCNIYPLTGSGTGHLSLTSDTSLVGTGTPTACSTNNVYISQIPADPLTSQNYSYISADGTSYFLCASLEQGGGSAPDCGSTCGSVSCNYEVKNP